ncbi:hypothetical protein RM780_21860 [Streptomyces sp. DSM 44917]|uniref:Secreted protein n=1 Tax=Streptomyces boetiae TaxID=3075541 RepID=A0ABU2LEA4_9ACTN|nr:hypothetical protein [Streptomyces sp. DSM 44917]MDT0309583.1 hypothetical protein [Streptomyces sp. DSM 44917]
MRRAATLLGTLAALAATGLALAAPASAARGQILLNGELIDNPNGCVNAESSPVTVDNWTTEYALVYEHPDCEGRVLAVVAPGAHTTQHHAHSVYVP